MKSRGNPVGRFIGAILGWVLIGGGVTLVFRVAFDLSLVGSCASGGPYVIARQCPTTIVTLLPIGVVAVGLSLLVAGVLSIGFGPSPFADALPLLLGGSAITVIVAVILHPYAFFSLIVAAILIAGTIPLIRTRIKRGRGREFLLGDASITGRPFPRADNTIGLQGEEQPPTAVDWMLGLGAGVVGAIVGVAIALPFALA